MTAPILKVAYSDKDFSISVDATKEGVCGILTQEWHVIFYESWKLKEHERNYATHDLELVDVIDALKMWWHYIIDIKFMLFIDNNDLKSVFS